MKRALVIPIYQPNAKVLPFLKSMNPSDFDAFVVVDDGSGEPYKAIFDEIRTLPGFAVISYLPNKGKGHALKEAFAYLTNRYPDLEGIVTADGDGQHAYSDILKIRDALEEHPGQLIMGVRDFNAPDVPKRNRKGNHFSSGYFHLATGKKLSDTQTGLRGIPARLFPLALNVYGSRYDYEMNFILDASKDGDFVEVPIQTIYDDNKSSHFHPVRDSMRIFRTPILYGVVALLSVAIDLGIFSIFDVYWPERKTIWWQILVSTVVARLISGTFNFSMNNFVVFKNQGGFARKLLKYLLVYFINMGLSFALVWAFSYLSGPLTLIKFVIDAILFVINFFIEQGWVFARKRLAARTPKEASKHD
jgi:putative flippase GtrA